MASTKKEKPNETSMKKAVQDIFQKILVSKGKGVTGVTGEGAKQKNGLVRKKILKKTRSATYIRTSTKTNKDRGGKQRALRATSAAAQRQKDTIGEVVHEIISGAAPLEDRSGLLGLMTKDGLDKIYVESSRDVARSVLVGEAVHALSKLLNVQIVVADNPGLMCHDETPQQRFNRLLGLLMQEYDRDQRKYILENGLQDRRDNKGSRSKHDPGQAR
jgi:hypothetical protein